MPYVAEWNPGEMRDVLVGCCKKVDRYCLFGVHTCWVIPKLNYLDHDWHDWNDCMVWYAYAKRRSMRRGICVLLFRFRLRPRENVLVACNAPPLYPSGMLFVHGTWQLYVSSTIILLMSRRCKWWPWLTQNKAWIIPPRQWYYSIKLKLPNRSSHPHFNKEFH